MKEKQIEEMARDIPSDIVTYNGKPKGLHLYIEQKQEIAKTLVKQGYRKIPKDSVVLSKTDFDLLLPTNRVVLSIEEYEKLVRPSKVDFIRQERYIREETAKEIFAKIDKALCECTKVVNRVIDGLEFQGYERTDLTKKLTKLANQFGADIEEYKKAEYRDDLLLKNYYGHAKEQTEKVQAAQKGEE